MHGSGLIRGDGLVGDVAESTAQRAAEGRLATAGRPDERDDASIGIRHTRRMEHQRASAEGLQRGQRHVDSELFHSAVEGLPGVERDGQVGHGHGIRAGRSAPCRAEPLALRVVESVTGRDQDAQPEHVDDEVRRHDARCVLLRGGVPSSSRADGSARTGSLLGVLASSSAASSSGFSTR